MSIASEILRIQRAKDDIRNAIIQKGVYVEDTLTIDDFSEKILQIEGGGGGTDYFAERINGTLTSYNIPNSVTGITSYALYRCSSITSITIPNSVISIGTYAFQYCTKLTSIRIPDSVVAISQNAFANCSGLTSVTIGKGVKTIPTSGFTSCSGITSIEMSEGVTSIGTYAFANCSNITSIRIPDSVTDILSNAYQGCRALTSTTIGGNTTRIGNYAFSGCSELSEIISYEAIEPSISASTFNGVKTGGTLHVPKGMSSAYSTWMSTGNNYLGKYNWSIVDDVEYNPPKLIVNYNVTSTSTATVIKYQNATLSANTVWINDETTPRRLTSKQYTFEQIGDNKIEFDFVTDIPSQSFYQCSAITEVTILDGVTSINSMAFQYCSGLTSITIPDSVTLIDGQAFYMCNKLTSIRLPNKLRNIAVATFHTCSELSTIEIPNSVTSIGTYAFTNCSKLYSVIYNGTKAQWANITKGTSWKNGVPSSCTVYCTDGNINI